MKQRSGALARREICPRFIVNARCQRELGMRVHVPLTSCTLFFCGAGACGTTSPVAPSRDSSPVQTDSTIYHLERNLDALDAWATVTYVNRTGSAVYFERCYFGDSTPTYTYQRIEGPSLFDRAGWSNRTVVGIAWACYGGVPTGVLAAGDSISIRVWVGSADSPHAYPPVTYAERIGTFRILLDLCATYAIEVCSLLPVEQRRSNEFLLRLP